MTHSNKTSYKGVGNYHIILFRFIDLKDSFCFPSICDISGVLVTFGGFCCDESHMILNGRYDYHKSCICDVIKLDESLVRNTYFERQPILVFYSFCIFAILIVDKTVEVNKPYLGNHKVKFTAK